MSRWRSMLPSWLPEMSWGFGAIMVLAGLVGAGGIIFTVEFNKHTSTTKFCTTCHSVAPMLDDPHYRQSKHISNSAGIQVNCGTCHIPTDNIFQETFVHTTSGIRDLILEFTTDLSDQAAGAARRRENAKRVRAN